MSLVTRLIYKRRSPVLGRVAKELLALYGVEFPAGVTVGKRLQVPHRGFGLVVHQTTVIGDDVTLYHGVTIGRADAGRPDSAMESIQIHDGVTVYPGAKIICKAGTLVVGAGAVIGANAVVTHSVPAGETWAGVPARRVGQ
jgi:serine O-acetyltransferase